MSNIKKYERMPVTIVEAHNEALPHIYRAVGSWHLPLRDVTLVHFDSHPDMLIPTDMPADMVYHKHQLFEWLSIENWILPAVYAGHINHIVWLKPPWSDQIPEQTVEFSVGCCTKSATIKTSCTENYFVSEMLYAPESQLVNKQKLRLTVMTIRPQGWGRPGETMSPRVEDYGNHGEPPSCPAPDQNEECDTSDNNTGSSVEETQDKRMAECQCENGVDKDNSEATTIPVRKKRRLADDGEYLVQDNCVCSKPFEKEDNIRSQCVPDHKCSKPLVSEPLPSKDELDRLSRLLDGQYWILDIDLDFYSTKNPFREMYGREQYSILQELYRFDKPNSLSVEDLQYCSLKRTKQLSALKHVFNELEQNSDAAIDHPSTTSISSLVSSLRASTPGPVDWGLVHEAGCTCDDTELPHHISSNTQVTALVDAVQDFLSYLHKPTIVTVARSSEDDYCPPNQVDMIEEAVLNMLQDLYLDITVHKDYIDDEPSSPETSPS